MNNKNGFVGSSLLFDWCFLWSNSHDALGIRYTDSQSDNAKRYTLRNLGFAIGIPERNCIAKSVTRIRNRNPVTPELLPSVGHIDPHSFPPTSP